MRLISFSTVILLLAAYEARAQTDSLLVVDKTVLLLPFKAENQSLASDRSVGVPRYVPPTIAHYRLLFGVGGNAGLINDAPLSYIGSASYQLGHSLYSASFIASTNNTRQPPRNMFIEFDLLYGLAVDEVLPHYETSPQSLHLSLSAGIGLDTYSVRWRFRRRDFVDTAFASFPPNTFEYAPGFPVQLQAIYEPFRFAGIGAMLFANFNRISPNYGGALVIQAHY